MKCPAFDDDHQVIGAAHEITGFDLFEAADALSKPIESSLAFRGNLYLDQRADLSFPSGIRVKHGPPAEQNVVSFQLGQVGLNGGRFAGQDFSHLFGAETLAIQKHLQDIIHSVFVADSVAARSKKRKQWRAREKAELRPV